MLIEGLDITRPAHACIKIISQTKRVFYFDPFQISHGEKADYIFITHEHYDHCSIADIRKIIKPETIIVTVPDCQSKIAGLPVKEVKLVKPGDQFKLPHCDVMVVPAYNVNKRFHLKENQWVGFIVRIDSKVMYHMGDTDIIPEMKSLSGIDIAFVPVSGMYVMSPQEAAQIINFLKPKIAIPIHYGAVIGTNEDAEKFRSLVSGTVILL